jgi:DNA-binding GntR family transcriptional regulator
LHFTTKTEMAYEAIRKGIIEGAYEPGRRMKIQALAREFGVSDIPVREALKKLEAEGLVNSIPHAGFTVTQPDFSSQQHIFEVRQLLEVHAVQLAVGNMTPEILKRLKTLQNGMKRVCKDDMVELAQLNYEFHDTIYSSCNNPTLYKLIQQVWALSARTRSIFSLMPDRGCASVEEHQRIYESLEAGDSQGAQDAFRKHKEESYKLLAEYDSAADVDGSRK